MCGWIFRSRHGSRLTLRRWQTPDLGDDDGRGSASGSFSEIAAPKHLPRQGFGDKRGLDPACCPSPLKKKMVTGALEARSTSWPRPVQPDTIDPVRVDIALCSVTGPLLLKNLSFFRHRDCSLHLVPESAGLSAKLGRHGVEIDDRLSWDSLWDCAAGLESAAAQIVLACTMMTCSSIDEQRKRT